MSFCCLLLQKNESERTDEERFTKETTERRKQIPGVSRKVKVCKWENICFHLDNNSTFDEAAVFLARHMKIILVPFVFLLRYCHELKMCL